jgi:hypothetical protein
MDILDGTDHTMISYPLCPNRLDGSSKQGEKEYWRGNRDKKACSHEQTYLYRLLLNYPGGMSLLCECPLVLAVNNMLGNESILGHLLEDKNGTVPLSPTY